MSTELLQDVRRIADDIKLQIHLAGMETRDRWHVLERRLTDAETRVERAGHVVGDEIGHELAELRAALLHVRDEIYWRMRDDLATGW
ncbi:MAG: hypothetical protein AB7T06_26240 [Kofleriaceae bacterium]